MACSVECLNFFEDCYNTPNKSLYAELPNDLIFKIIKEADGGRYTHKQKLKKVHQEMKDIIARSMSNYQEGVAVEEECEWRPINKSPHSEYFWGGWVAGDPGMPTGRMFVNVEWPDIYDITFRDTFWEAHAEYMVQDSILSLWCLGDDLSVFGRLGYREDHWEYIRYGGDWEEISEEGSGLDFRIYSNPSDCPRYALQ